MRVRGSSRRTRVPVRRPFVRRLLSGSSRPHDVCQLRLHASCAATRLAETLPERYLTASACHASSRAVTDARSPASELDVSACVADVGAACQVIVSVYSVAPVRDGASHVGAR